MTWASQLYQVFDASFFLLACFLANSRIKEISVRRVLGAMTGFNGAILTPRFAVLILIAVAGPWPGSP